MHCIAGAGDFCSGKKNKDKGEMKTDYRMLGKISELLIRDKESFTGTFHFSTIVHTQIDKRSERVREFRKQ